MMAARKNGNYRPQPRSLSIVMPFYNEAAGVAETARRLETVLAGLRHAWSIELILVDDGSTDETAARLREQFANDRRWRVRVLSHDCPLGFGAALRTGLEAASGDCIVTTDGACSYPPEEIPNLLQCLTLSGCDVVTGSPYHPVLAAARKGGHRRLSKVVCHVYHWLTPAKVYSHTCLFRAYRREWAKRHLEFADSYLGITENLLNLAFQGATIVEYPIALRKPGYGATTGQTLQVIGQHLGLIGRLLRGAHARRPRKRWQQPTIITLEPAGEEPADFTPLLGRWALVRRHNAPC